VSLHAQDLSGAILHTTGSVLLNTSPAPPSAALYGSSHIQTQLNAAARITASGSTADLGPETIVDFENSELSLIEGSLAVNTSRGWKIRDGCRTVMPLTDSQWAEYEVSDANRQVIVSAVKGELDVESRLSNPHPENRSPIFTHTTIRMGEKRSFNENCDKDTGAKPPADKPLLDTYQAKIIGIGLVGAAICWALCLNGPEPVSPWRPK
jgi:hypothetical protein